MQGFAADRGGAISIIGALVLVPVIGVAALALEYGHGLLQKTENQRVADLAAFAGALVYGSTSSNTNATGAAAKVAALNGISCSSCASVVRSPTGDGNSAVMVTVTTSVPLILARVLTTSTTLPVTATGYAEIKSNAPACVLALSGSGSGIALSGTGSITAPGCAIASNSTVCANSRANPSDVITTKVIDYGSGSSPLSSSCTVSPPSGTSSVKTNKVITTDPLATSSGSPGSTEVTNATAHLGFNSSGGCAGTAGTVCAITSPTAPSVPSVSSVSGGSAVDFGWSALTGPLPGGCSANLSASVWTVTCSGSGPFTFGTITHNGDVTVNIQASSGATYNFANSIPSGVGLTGSGPGIYNFTGAISTAGTTSFAPGSYHLVGSITTAGTTTFGAGTFNVTGGITTAGTTNFGVGTYNVGGAISVAGTTNFGAGTYNVVSGISTGGGSTTTFGAGTFTLGKSSASCNSSSGYSICNTGTTLSFAGPSTFVLSGGIYNSGGETLIMGTAGTTTNSYNIGAANDGNSIAAGGGATTTLYDASGNDANGAPELFKTAGNIVNGGSSSTCLTLPAAAQHDIKGSVALSCGATLGAGVYTITGYFALGGNGGGGTVTGSNVALVIGGASVPSSGSCNGLAFCVASGFGTVTLTAPSSGSAANLAVVGPASSSAHSTAGASFTEGSSNTTLSGAFYFPNGPVTMSGAGTINNAGGCLELIGSQVSMSGGSAATSTCTGLTGSSLGTAVFLVQ